MRFLTTILFAGICLAASCKKDDAKPVEPRCAVSGPISIDTGGSYFILPTAFTPNGDGINDVFRALVDKIDTAGFSITVSDSDTVVFQNNNPYFIWIPTQYMGVRKTFDVQVRFRTQFGVEIESCNTLTIPKIEPFTTCADEIQGLFFEDQIDIVDGSFKYTTAESECP